MTELTTPLIRPDWEFDEFHRQAWKDKEITAVMCERDTFDNTKLCLESLLRFYPDLPIVIVDGGSTDDSLNYVRMLESKYPNITVWHRIGRNGHGTMLHEAIIRYVRTKYVLLLDNDLIIKRGGWIEGMLDRMEGPFEPIYAVGSLMLVTNSGDACGEPKDEKDILRYVHPSCSLIRLESYLRLEPFVEHGAPLVYNMQDAQRRGWIVEHYPVEKYVCHLSGASWTTPRTIWRDDMDVMTRPFFSIILDNNSLRVLDILYNQEEKDVEIVPIGLKASESIHIFGIGPRIVDNQKYTSRFRVRGEYVTLASEIYNWNWSELTAAKRELIRLGMPEEAELNGNKFIKRKLWQERSTS